MIHLGAVRLEGRRLFDHKHGTGRQPGEAIGGAAYDAFIELRVPHKTHHEQVEPLLTDQPDDRLATW